MLALLGALAALLTRFHHLIEGHFLVLFTEPLRHQKSSPTLQESDVFNIFQL